MPFPPSSTMNSSASTIAAPISVAPSMSNVERGVVPADNPAPDPVNCVAETVPVTLAPPEAIVTVLAKLEVESTSNAPVTVRPAPITAVVDLRNVAVVIPLTFIALKLAP